MLSLQCLYGGILYKAILVSLSCLHFLPSPLAFIFWLQEFFMVGNKCHWKPNYFPVFCKGLSPIAEEGVWGCRRVEALGGQRRLKRDHALRVNLEVNLSEILKVTVLTNPRKISHPMASACQGSTAICIHGLGGLRPVWKGVFSHDRDFHWPDGLTGDEIWMDVRKRPEFPEYTFIVYVFYNCQDRSTCVGWLMNEWSMAILSESLRVLQKC